MREVAVTVVEKEADRVVTVEMTGNTVYSENCPSKLKT